MPLAASAWLPAGCDEGPASLVAGVGTTGRWPSLPVAVLCTACLMWPLVNQSCCAWQATGALMPLARFRISHLWLAFASSDKRAAALALSIPGIVGEDLRPWVPKEHSLVISSGQLAQQDSSVGAASFLTLDWAASAGMAEQHIRVRGRCPSAWAQLAAVSCS